MAVAGQQMYTMSDLGDLPELGVLQIRSPRIHFTLISLDIKKLHELTITDPTSSSSKPSSYSSKLSSTYATNDDELPAEKVSQKLVKEMSETIDEAKLRKVIVQVIKTYSELGHEHKFVTEIIVRRANGSIASITEPDYKNLNKNDIEDMYLLCIIGKLGVESYQQKVNLTAPTITFFGIKKHKMFSIISKPVYGIIYKKENRVMRHQEIHKFCDATLKRVLEGLKSYNNDVKHGYVTPSLSKEDAEYLQLFEEEIKERLKHRDQMRQIEMCTGMFKDQDEVVVAQEEVQEKVDLVENEEEELIEEEE
ncbi:hypothetical protein Tco_1293280 [Tanacetum coccineum]